MVETGHIIFEKTVINCADQWYQLKNDIYNNKRDQKNVAPFVVTNDLSFTLIHISTSAVLAVVPPEP